VCDILGAGFAQEPLGDGVGNGECTHTGGARGPDAGRGVFDGEALGGPQRQDVSAALARLV
jgi:hypothetical protein